MSRRDIDFLLYEWLNVIELTQRERYGEHDRDTFGSLLDIAEELAVEVFAPINKLLDEREPVMNPQGIVVQPAELMHALRAFSASGLTASTFAEELGGGQLPYVVRAACSMFLQAGSIAAYAYPFLSEANANLIVAHGTPEQIACYAMPIIEGRWFGTMCLSEQQAGSSLGDITTLATPQDDGSYRVTGSKMWISGGDHELSENIVHLVLARTPGAPAGPKGTSLFIVPRRLVDEDGSVGERNDITLVGLNHKMGYRGTTNTILAFGDGGHTPGGLPGAVGHLIGGVGDGLAIMFDMMNEARIGVGSGAVSLGYAGYLESLHYARNRPQGRSLTARDPRAAPVPIIDHPDVRRMLLAQKSYVEGGLALTLFCARLIDEQRSAVGEPERAEAGVLLGLLTPIAKSWPSQWCLKANDLAIQVHGGYGYTRDFPVEQYYRDNRLNMIHEGTHGIQALDLVGRKILRDHGAGLGVALTRMRRTIEAAAALGGAPAQHAALLEDQVNAVEHAFTGLVAADPTATLANASPGLEALGHVVIAWLWLEQETAAHGKEGSFYDGKRAAAAYFFGQELPIVPALLDLVSRHDRLTLDLDPTVL
jgi:alkylation response protein AidB-like acyl-CoA dehydrogenase